MILDKNMKYTIEGGDEEETRRLGHTEIIDREYNLEIRISNQGEHYKSKNPRKTLKHLKKMVNKYIDKISDETIDDIDLEGLNLRIGTTLKEKLSDNDLNSVKFKGSPKKETDIMRSLINYKNKGYVINEGKMHHGNYHDRYMYFDGWLSDDEIKIYYKNEPNKIHSYLKKKRKEVMNEKLKK